MACLDSDVLIDFLRNKKEVVSKIDKIRVNGEKLSTTSVNSFELFKGIPYQSKVSIEAIKGFLANLKIYNFNYSASEKSAEIFNDLKTNGEIIELPDIMIASIAIENGEPFLTNNKKHFERIKDLKLEEF